MQLRLDLLGPPQVLVGSDPLRVDTRKATALLMYLVVTGEVQRRESMAALFWPESDGPHAKAALRRTLSALRKALNGKWLHADREVVSAQADRLDCFEFAALIEGTRAHGHPTDQACNRCIAPLTEAAQLYRGDFLEGFTLPDSPGFDDWQYFHQLTYQRLYAESLLRLAAAHQSRQEFEVAIEYANRLLALDPLNEAAHRTLMSLYAASGMRQLALRQYQDCVRVLQEELGAPPLEETAELNERILAGELVPAASAAGRRPAAAGRHGIHETGEGLHGTAGAEGFASRPAESGTPAGELPLVGREAELAQMLAWVQEMQDLPLLLVVQGEQGIGKTRLASEFANSLTGRGARLLQARCYPDEATYAYRPWIDALRDGLRLVETNQRLESIPELWLGEVARLLPELRERFPDLDRSEPASAASGQDRFFESLFRVTAGLLDGPHPGMVLLDDLHWADEASLDYLTFLLRHGAGKPILILAGWRAEGLLGEQQLRSTLARFPRNRTQSIQLRRLSSKQVGELLQRAGLDQALTQEVLYAETEGLPFFVSEYLRAIQRHGAGSTEEMPPSIRQAIDGRLVALSGASQQLLSTAAVLGRSFEYETLRMVSGRSSDETVAGIEELVDSGSIREYPSSTPQLGPSYDFVHEKLREVALNGTTQARQRLLHARAAAALTRLRGRRHSELRADRIAHHLLRSGDEAGAAAMYFQAAEHARSLYANEEALAHYRHALALGHPEPAKLHEAIADLLTLTGRYAEAVRNYEAAAAMRPSDRNSPIEHKLGLVYQRWGRWQPAEARFAAATDAAGSDEERARILADWSLNAHRQGESDRAQGLIERALEGAESANDPRALAQCQNILGVLARARGDAKSARQHLKRSLHHASRLADPGVRAAALNNLALALARDGEIEAALEAGDEALEISLSLGDRHRAAALYSNLADLLHQAGDERGAQEQLTRSAELFAAIGMENGEYEPEIWKLVEW